MNIRHEPRSVELATMPLWPDAARMIGIGRSTAFELARRGEFPGALRLGHRWLVSRRLLELWLSGETNGRDDRKSGDPGRKCPAD